ncbi:MAG: hypothetical protein V4813_12980 [Gemmatimonadota bacterium]
MLRFRCLLILVPRRFLRTAGDHPALASSAFFAPLTLLVLVTSTLGAQVSGAPSTPLHLAATRFDFIASGDPEAPAKPLRVHNGGTERFTDVRLTKLAYSDSTRGAAWLVALPGQSVVAPDELATVGTLCVDASGLAAGIYRAKAAVAAREVPEPVAITVTLVVTDVGARARHTTARCGPAIAK